MRSHADDAHLEASAHAGASVFLGSNQTAPAHG